MKNNEIKIIQNLVKKNAMRVERYELANQNATRVERYELANQNATRMERYDELITRVSAVTLRTWKNMS